LFFDREDFIPPQLWMGAAPTHIPTSSLHRDPLTGFLFQVMGRSGWTFTRPIRRACFIR